MTPDEFQRHLSSKADTARANLAPPLDKDEIQKRRDAIVADMWAGGDGRIDFTDPNWERKHKRNMRRRQKRK